MKKLGWLAGVLIVGALMHLVEGPEALFAVCDEV